MSMARVCHLTIATVLCCSVQESTGWSSPSEDVMSCCERHVTPSAHAGLNGVYIYQVKRCACDDAWTLNAIRFVYMNHEYQISKKEVIPLFTCKLYWVIHI